MRDFTLRKYEDILKALTQRKISTYKIENAIIWRSNAGVLIRHDVDRRPRNALAMAKLEAKYGIYTTYYFRAFLFQKWKWLIKEIYSLGHEIGYHYEELATNNGDIVRSKQAFQKHLNELRSVAPVITVAMHGSPLSKYDNRDFWKHYSLKEFDLKFEALESIDYTDVFYITDSGRTWGESSANLRDRVINSRPSPCHTTKDLVAFIQTQSFQHLALVCHPERFDNNYFLWTVQALKDKLINTIKLCLRILHSKS